METFRHSDRSISSHISRDRVQPFSNGHHLSGMSPQDSDDEKGSTAPRKRIALAVGPPLQANLDCVTSVAMQADASVAIVFSLSKAKNQMQW